MPGIFGDLFDLDGNGKLDWFEETMEFMLLEELEKELEDDDFSDDEDE